MVMMNVPVPMMPMVANMRDGTRIRDWSKINAGRGQREEGYQFIHKYPIAKLI
jgi:hypothetical protein